MIISGLSRYKIIILHDTFSYYQRYSISHQIKSRKFECGFSNLSENVYYLIKLTNKKDLELMVINLLS